MNITLFSKATLKGNFVGKEDNNKYLVALYTHFTFSAYFSLASPFLGNLRHEAKVFIHFSFILGYFV